MICIYIIELKENKWYIGKTDNNKFRLEKNIIKNNNFVKLYAPISIYKIIENCDKYDLDKYVKKYMDIYGIDNVRGGSYINIKLNKTERELIMNELQEKENIEYIEEEEKQKLIEIKKEEEKQKVIDIGIKEIMEMEYEIDKEMVDNIKRKISSNTCVLYNSCNVNKVNFYKTAYNEGWVIDVLSGKDVNRRNMEEYFSIDNFELEEYIYKNKEIMDLYKEYVKTLDKNIFINTYKTGIINNMDNCNRYILGKKKIFEIEDKIKNLLVDICYIKVNEIIRKKYHRDYIITNYNMKMDICENICKMIYFKYYMEDYWNMDIKIEGNVPIIMMENSIVSKDMKYRKIRKVVDIYVKGEIYYSI